MICANLEESAGILAMHEQITDRVAGRNNLGMTAFMGLGALILNNLPIKLFLHNDFFGHFLHFFLYIIGQ
jgi:hypothetical protein